MRRSRGTQCPGLSASELVEEVAPEWIVLTTDGTVRIAHKLGDDVPVAHRAQEVDQVPEFPVDVDLLEICLRLSLRIVLVLRVRPLEEGLSVVEDDFPLDERAANVVLGKSNLVLPEGLFLVIADGHANAHI